MSDKDEDLLARLNALKPSSVGFDTNAKSPAIDIEVSKPTSIEDKLAERLKGLRSGSGRLDNFSSADLPKCSTKSTSSDAAVSANEDPIRNWQHDDHDDSTTLEQLLAELGPDDQWKLDPDDPSHIDSLLKEAKAALPPDDQQDVEGNDQQLQQSQDTAEKVSGDVNDVPNKTEDQQDEDDADDYVKRVLAELEVEKKYGLDDSHGDDGDNGPAETGDSTLNLPSTPSNMPQPVSSAEPPTYEDSELEARFSKLGLDLPSTPSTAPSSRAKAASKTGAAGLKKAQAKSSLPTYTNDDIDSWCCICNEDGEVRCLGCNGDIYCQNCWTEGHGDGPGQERGHRAVQYNRKPPATAAAA